MFLHVFRRRELIRALRLAEFRVRELIPLDPRRHQALHRPWLLPICGLTAGSWFANDEAKLKSEIRNAKSEMCQGPDRGLPVMEPAISQSDSDAGFRPTASWQNLRLRAELLRKLRQFFYDRGFLEVETPLLSADVVVDRHLDPLSFVLPDDPRKPDVGRRMWLQTSPEFAMKRLLAAGGEQRRGPFIRVTRAFRGDEIGPLHNPEFTIVEWYRIGDDMRPACSCCRIYPRRFWAADRRSWLPSARCSKSTAAPIRTTTPWRS